MDSRTNIDIAGAWPPGSPNLGAPAASNSNPAYDFDVPAPRGPSKTFLPRTNPNGSPDLCDRTAAKGIRTEAVRACRPAAWVEKVRVSVADAAP